MARWVVMGRDETGQEFNAGNCYFASETEAEMAWDRIKEMYEEASLWIEPLFSDLAREEYFGFGSWSDYDGDHCNEDL